ncbi:MAG: hypothetical protein R3A78_13480 [Polyangiales bacterium]
MTQHKAQPKGVNVAVRTFAKAWWRSSASIAEPQFQGQTKDRLNNPEVTAQVENTVRAAPEQWLHANKHMAESIIGAVVPRGAAQLVSRSATQEGPERAP